MKKPPKQKRIFLLAWWHETAKNDQKPPRHATISFCWHEFTPPHTPHSAQKRHFMPPCHHATRFLNFYKNGGGYTAREVRS